MKTKCGGSRTARQWLAGICAAAASSVTVAAAAQPATPYCLGGGSIETACLTADRFSKADVLVLGEVHDNSHHHALRARIIARFAKEKRGRIGVVMEHIRTTEAAALVRFQAGIDRTKPQYWKSAAAGLGPALAWDKSGWPKWDMFLPMAEAAFQANAKIYAGDVPRDEMRSVARKGLAVLPEPRRRALRLDAPLPAGELDSLLTELEASHCGLIPKAAFGTMAEAQRLRDATLADATIVAARLNGAVVLLAGNGHVRDDRGVPWYIRRSGAGLDVATVLFVEAPADASKSHDPTSGLRRASDGKAAADAVVVTERMERADPCIAMRERFKKRK